MSIIVSIINKRIQLVMKQQRIADYTIKIHHKRKQKQVVKEKLALKNNFEQTINKLDPEGLIKFMQEEYKEIIKKQQQLSYLINTVIIKRLQQLKSDWRAFHRQLFLDYVRKNQLNLIEDPKLSFRQNAIRVNRNCFTYFKIVSDQTFVGLAFSRHKRVDTRYYLQEQDERIDFKIQFKRMVSDVVFQCENFLALVEKINRIMGVKEYFYR